jgi:GntR family transcriptional regulator
VRERILSGEYPPGSELPTDADFKAEFLSGEETIRRGLRILMNEGYVTPGNRQHRRRVREVDRIDFYALLSESVERLNHRRQLGSDTWNADASDQGHVAGHLQIRVGIEQATPEIAARLGIPAGDLVVARRRVRTLNGELHNSSDSFYPRALVDGTDVMSPADIPQGVISYLRDLKGIEQADYQDELEWRMPTPAEVALLSILPGVPVLLQYRTGYTSGGEPVRVTVTTWPGDRARLVYRFPADVGSGGGAHA